MPWTDRRAPRYHAIIAVTLSQLRTFVTVLRTGSVTRAGEELVVTQPSVSGALAALAKEVGARLVERDGRGLRPTAAGNALLPYAEKVLALLEDGRQAAHEAADPTHRRLRLAAASTAGEYLVPSLLRAFGERAPDVELSLEVGNRAAVLASLDRHEVDVAIAGQPAAEGRISGIPLLDDEFVVIASPASPWCARNGVSAGQLADLTWLVREAGSGTRAVSTEFFARHDLSPRMLTIGSNGAVKQGVAAGLGIALVSRVGVIDELRAGTLAAVDMRSDLPVRSWFVLYLTDGPRRSAPDEFLAFARSGVAAAVAESAILARRQAGSERAGASARNR